MLMAFAVNLLASGTVSDVGQTYKAACMTFYPSQSPRMLYVSKEAFEVLRYLVDLRLVDSAPAWRTPR